MSMISSGPKNHGITPPLNLDDKNRLNSDKIFSSLRMQTFHADYRVDEWSEISRGEETEGWVDANKRFQDMFSMALNAEKVRTIEVITAGKNISNGVKLDMFYTSHLIDALKMFIEAEQNDSRKSTLNIELSTANEYLTFLKTEFFKFDDKNSSFNSDNIIKSIKSNTFLAENSIEKWSDISQGVETESWKNANKRYQDVFSIGLDPEIARIVGKLPVEDKLKLEIFNTYILDRGLRNISKKEGNAPKKELLKQEWEKLSTHFCDLEDNLFRKFEISLFDILSYK